MLSYQVREYYEYLIKKLNNFKTNMENIIEFENQYQEIISSILKKVISTKRTIRDTNGTHYIIKDGGLQEQFKNMIGEFKSKFEFFNVFNDYVILKSDIEKYSKKVNINYNSILNFFEKIDQFFKLYQNFMQSDNDMELAIEFGQHIKEVVSVYDVIVQVYTEIEMSICDSKNNINDNSNGKICIQLLDVQYDLEEFSNNLRLISEIYNEIGIIMYKDKSYKKVRIEKIESGSLLSLILGDENIIESISLLLNKSVNLVFNKFTYEGKIMRHKEFRNELLEDIELSKKMKELGYDVKEAEKNNKESLTLLTKDLLKLSNSSPKIKIDNNEYSIKESKQKEFIESSKKLLLTDENKKLLN